MLLALTPQSSGYSVAESAGYLSAELAGGLSRQRRDILNPYKSITLSFAVDEYGYEYLRAFYRHASKQTEKFTLSAVTEYAEIEPHQGYFVPGSWRLDSFTGSTYRVSCQVWALAVAEINHAFDASLVAFVGAYGSIDAAIAILRPLEQLSNYDLLDGRLTNLVDIYGSVSGVISALTALSNLSNVDLPYGAS